jgi:hypothetical protein
VPQLIDESSAGPPHLIVVVRSPDVRARLVNRHSAQLNEVLHPRFKG